MNAVTLLRHHREWCVADAARMAARPARMPRMAWAGANPIPYTGLPMARDTARKSKPARYIGFIDHSSRMFVSSRKRLTPIYA